jgi:hypothetical protein
MSNTDWEHIEALPHWHECNRLPMVLLVVCTVSLVEHRFGTVTVSIIRSMVSRKVLLDTILGLDVRLLHRAFCKQSFRHAFDANSRRSSITSRQRCSSCRNNFMHNKQNGKSEPLRSLGLFEMLCLYFFILQRRRTLAQHAVQASRLLVGFSTDF